MSSICKFLSACFNKPQLVEENAAVEAHILVAQRAMIIQREAKAAREAALALPLEALPLTTTQKEQQRKYNKEGFFLQVMPTPPPARLIPLDPLPPLQNEEGQIVHEWSSPSLKPVKNPPPVLELSEQQRSMSKEETERDNRLVDFHGDTSLPEVTTVRSIFREMQLASGKK